MKNDSEIAERKLVGKKKKKKNNKEKTAQQQKGLPTLSADLNQNCETKNGRRILF